MRVLSGLNLFLAVPQRGQSPFIENTARSHWKQQHSNQIHWRLQEQAMADLLCYDLYFKSKAPTSTCTGRRYTAFFEVVGMERANIQTKASH